MLRNALKVFYLGAIALILSFCTHNNDTTRGPVSPHQQENAYRHTAPSRTAPTETPKHHEEKSVAKAIEEQKWRNEALQDKVHSLFDELEDCHTYLTDPRLGGNSNTFRLPEFEELETSMVPQKMGYNRYGEYTVSSTESYEDILAREERKEKELESRLSLLKNTFKRCKAQLTEARVRYGLPAEKYPAIVEKTPSGGLKVRVPAERNLDDAFKRKRIEAQFD